MPSTDSLVSIGLPVRNGEELLSGVVGSVLAQDHGDLELVISDNASTDGTEDLCRELARSDPRIVYHRRSANIGIVNNFVATMRLARGTFFRWIGDDDSLAPNCVSRCLDVFAADERLILVTTQMAYLGADGVTQTVAYDGTGLSSDDPADRFTEMLRLLNESHLLMDPLYGLMRRAPAMAIPRRAMLREDEVFAARMALAGPWGHVSEILAHRHRDHQRPARVARRLDVPAWHVRVERVLQCRELIRCVRAERLTPGQRRRALTAIAALYLRNHQQLVARRSARIAAYAARLVAGRASNTPTGG